MSMVWYQKSEKSLSI
jgi:exoribonuclease R